MLRIIASPRTLVFLTLLLAFLVRFKGYDAFFGEYLGFLEVLVGVLVIGALSLAFTAFRSFDIESKTAFVLDIVIDVSCFAACVAMLAYLSTLHIYGADVSSQAIVLTGIALGLMTLDLLVSLNAGAGKLLEMDREHFTRDRLL